MAKTGNRINLIAFRGQRFGHSVVIEPELRRGQRPEVCTACGAGLHRDGPRSPARSESGSLYCPDTGDRHTPGGKPHGYRHALMECRCGTRYLAQLSHLYRGMSQQCPDCARRETYRKRRHAGGLVSKNGDAWAVTVYIGRYRTRAQAEAIAKRARAMILPEKQLQEAKNGAMNTLT